jgi:transcriptional regulator with XRE-family HTH domain
MLRDGHVHTVPGMPDLAAHIARNVAAERARRRWRQRDLADRLGWSVSTVSDLENGKRAVTANDLPLLCRAFGVNLSKLTEGASQADLDALA